MKIAVFHELHSGGARRAAEALTRELRKKHQVTEFDPVFISSSTSERGILNRIKNDFLGLIYLAFKHWQLSRKIDQTGFELVIVHPSRWTQAPFLLSFLRTKSVYFCQEPLRLAHDPIVSRVDDLRLPNRVYELVNRTWRGWIDFVNTKSANFILANSRFSKKWIDTVYEAESSVCYLGVDVTLFRPKKLNKRYDVLFFGTPVEIEGYSLLTEAMELSKKKWKVRTLERSIDGRGVSDTELVQIINQSKMVVCLAKSEPFGLTVLEGMSCGVPVIAVSEGGYKESVIDGETGFLVRRDAKDLEEKINKLLSSPTLRVRLGKRGREVVEKQWTWEMAGERLKKLLPDEVAAEGKFDFLPLAILLLGTGLVAIFATILFKATRHWFLVPSPGPAELNGFATYYGYPVVFDPLLFFVVLSTPIWISLVLRKIKL